MDEELMYALSNRVASYVASETKNVEMYEKRAMKLIQQYAFKLFNTPTEQ